ncbi:MAG: sialidase family protein [Pirellulales bacterium]
MLRHVVWGVICVVAVVARAAEPVVPIGVSGGDPRGGAAQVDPVARFGAMSADEIRAYELDVARRVADLALVPPKLNTNPSPKYDADKLDYGMTIGIARTPKGRIWACWVAGGDSPKAFFVLAASDDDGETWSKPKLVVDTHAPSCRWIAACWSAICGPIRRERCGCFSINRCTCSTAAPASGRPCATIPTPPRRRGRLRVASRTA